MLFAIMILQLIAVGVTASLSDSALVAQARQQPDSTRAALTRAFAAVASSTTARDRDKHLAHARQLASSYARAWSDEFFVRQVVRFASWSPSQRRTRVVADSLRVAGNSALTSDGVPRAMAVWKQSLRQATALNDPAVIAPVIVAIGAGFYRSGELDSASVYLTRGQNLAEQSGDLRTTGNALGILASVTKDRGDIDRAVTLYARASAIRARSGDSRGIAADQNNLGLIAKERGNFREAWRAFQRALAINQRENRSSLVALNLGNLAGVASMTGNYSSADSLYQRALSIQRANGENAETGFTLHDLGRLRVRRGDYRQARSAFNDALRIHQASGAVADAVAVQADLAELESASGDPEAALQTLRQAERRAAAAQLPPEQLASVALAHADVAMQFGTFAEAEAGYQRAAQFYIKARSDLGRAQAQQGRGILRHLRGDDAAALALLNDAMGVQNSAGDLRSVALTQLVVAEVQQSQGDNSDARQTLRSALATLRSVSDPIGEAAALNAIGDLNLRNGATSSAQQFYSLGLTRLGNRAAGDVRWRLHAGKAEALERSGALSAAAAEYRKAISAVEQTAARVRLEERRSGFLSDKWSVYTQLALLEQSRGMAAEAFAVSERMRARQMLDLLARGRIASPRATSQREQDLRRRIGELTEELEAGSPYRAASREPALMRSADAIRRELDATQKSYAKLLQQIREKDPDYARLISASTVPWRTVASRLRKDEVLLAYLLGDSTSTVFVVTKDTIAAVDLQTSRRTISDLVEFAHRTMERRDAATTKALWRVPLRRLYSVLIAPLEQRGYLNGRNVLIVAPHAELHFLSFAALIAGRQGDQFLAQRFQVAYTPSASAWVHLGNRRTGGGSAGVLALAPHVDRLPASRQEVLALRQIYSDRASVRLGAAATEQSLRAGVRNTSILHLATFGVLNKHNPLFSFVELAPTRQDDGRLEVNEVFDLGLSGQLVVLSACQTALSSGATADVPPGDDWVGLVQAFLQAGARSVVASLWPVDDRATARLMEQFHRRLAAGRPPVAALAEAQRNLLRDPASSSPFYWAGFVFNTGAR